MALFMVSPNDAKCVYTESLYIAHDDASPGNYSMTVVVAMIKRAKCGAHL